MAKIAFIGAGSFGFTRTLVKDILTFENMADAELALMDIDPERLKFSKLACERIVREGNYPAKVTATLDRREALEGADAVLVTILNGGVQVWRHDIEIPMKYGVSTNVGDTRSVSGIFRALRTIPVMVGITKDMEELCPNALLLNYTNPMAMLCRAMQRESKIAVSGLCHSVQGTAGMLAHWAGVPAHEVDYVCAGINHLSFFTSFEHKGVDLYPKLKQVVAKNKKIYNEEHVRNEMFLALGYYVTESSGHNSEYNWWFRKTPELIEKYCSSGTGWNPGEYAYILKHYLSAEKNWVKEIDAWLNNPAPLDLARGHEYAASIINAWLGGDIFRFNGNVPNNGCITNLPENCCVEIPVFAERNRLNSSFVGELPQSVQPIVALTVAIEEMVVEACLTGNPELVCQAVSYDPLSAAVLSLADIKKMVQQMLNKNKDYLPTFTNVKI